jgi:hypothetical protein
MAQARGGAVLVHSSALTESTTASRVISITGRPRGAWCWTSARHFRHRVALLCGNK